MKRVFGQVLWTEERIANFRSLYTNTSIHVREIAKVFNMTTDSIYDAAARLGISRGRALNVRTPEWKTEFLQMWADGAPAKEIAQKYNLSERSVLTYAHRFGGTKARSALKKFAYNADNLAFLRKNYAHISTKMCAMMLGTSLAMVRKQAAAMGLKKSKEYHNGAVSVGRKLVFDGKHPRFHYREAELVHKYDIASCWRVRFDDGVEADADLYVASSY